jgi:hypothetical protein
VPGALVARRCAESFRYFKRADIVGEAIPYVFERSFEGAAGGVEI